MRHSRALTLCWKCIAEMPALSTSFILSAHKPQTEASSLQRCFILDSFLPTPWFTCTEKGGISVRRPSKTACRWKSLFSIPGPKLECYDTEMEVSWVVSQEDITSPRRSYKAILKGMTFVPTWDSSSLVHAIAKLLSSHLPSLEGAVEETVDFGFIC